jgi:hypothetical protein
MAEKILFHGEGQSTTGSAIWYLVVLGVVGGLTALIVSFALPIGPWWLWLIVIAAFVWLATWEMSRSSMTIDLLEVGDELRLRLGGRGATLDEELRPGHERWTCVVTNSVRYGGPMLSWNVVVYTTRGRRIGFHQLGGPSDKLDWPARRDKLGDGADIYSTLNVFSLERALQAAARAGAA